MHAENSLGYFPFVLGGKTTFAAETGAVRIVFESNRDCLIFQHEISRLLFAEKVHYCQVMVHAPILSQKFADGGQWILWSEEQQTNVKQNAISQLVHICDQVQFYFGNAGVSMSIVLSH